MSPQIAGGVSFDPLALEAARAPRNGEQIVDPRLFAKWDSAFGALKRATDAISIRYGRSKLCDQLNELLIEAFDMKDQWHESLA